eukprot:g25917.t1
MASCSSSFLGTLQVRQGHFTSSREHYFDPQTAIRNPSRGKATVEAMEEASRSSNKMQSFEYRSADLSTIKACLNFIIQLQVGERKTEPFDFLVLTLGVWPNWKEPISSEGLDKVVAVDLVARYLLMTKVPLKPNARVMSVLASGRWVGQPSLDTFKAMITGSTPVTPFTWASKMMGTLALSADALLLKAASQSHQSQPGIRFIGTHPGIVDTDLSVNTIPKWMHDIVFAVLKMMGMTVTQSQTGTVHALILGSPQLGQVSQRASFWTEDGVARQTHPMAYDQEVQDWLWHFLLQTVNRLSTVHDVDNTPQ